MKKHFDPRVAWRHACSAGLLVAASFVQAHESAHAPGPSATGPVRGKTVHVRQSQIDLLMAAQPEMSKLDATSKQHTQAQVREVLLQRALLERGAIESGLDKDPSVQLQLQAARQLVLANAYGKRLADPRKVADKDIEAEYRRASADLTDTEYQMRRLVFVDQAKAQEAIKALQAKTDFVSVMTKLAMPSPQETPGEWRWIAAQRMPQPVLEEVQRLRKNPQSSPQAVRVEGNWYVVQVQAERAAQVPPRSEIQEDIRNKLAQAKVQQWLSQRKKTEGLDKVVEQQVAKR